MSPTAANPPEALAFPQQAAEVARNLRSAVGAVLNATPGLTDRRPVGLRETLRIDGNLAWKIARVLKAEDPFVAARHLPGTEGFRIFLLATTAAGAPKGLVTAAHAAFDSFMELKRTHAGSRTALCMMLDAQAQEGGALSDLEHRRKAFEANSFIWGVQARANFKLNVVAPATDSNFMDLGSIRGFVDLRRIRPNVPWRIFQTSTFNDSGNLRTEFTREPLVNATDVPGTDAYLGLIPDFCSRPLPQCRQVNGPRGERRFELAEGAVGNIGILTCVFGEIIRCVEPRFCCDGLRQFAISNHLRTPVEFAITDLVLHRDLFGPDAALDFRVYSDLFADQTAPTYFAGDLLPVRETVQRLGCASESPPSPEIPRHNDMLRLVFDRCGWNPEDFEVFRVVMHYPPIPANLRFTRDLPDAPKTQTPSETAGGCE
jgi:hypothetical protein